MVGEDPVPPMIRDHCSVRSNESVIRLSAVTRSVRLTKAISDVMLRHGGENILRAQVYSIYYLEKQEEQTELGLCRRDQSHLRPAPTEVHNK